MSIIRIIKKFHSILSRRQKNHILVLSICMVIGGFLEMLSVSLILPFMNMVMNPAETMEKPLAKMICEIFDIQTDRLFLITMAVFLAMIYILKNAFLIFQNYLQNRFISNNLFSTQALLLHQYIYRPYDFFIKVNSGEILRVITRNTVDTFMLLSALITFFSELVVMMALFITILTISPVLTLSITIILLLVMLIILYIIRPVLTKAGQDNQVAESKMNQWILQAIQGIKEMKVTRKQAFFESNFQKNGKIAAIAYRKNTVLSNVPRYIIEAVCMGTLFLALAIMMYCGERLDTMIPMVAALAMAAVRMLPSVNRISGALSTMAYMEPMLDKMTENLIGVYDDEPETEGNRRQGKIRSFTNRIGFSNVSYHYPGSKELVLKDASIQIEKGSSIGLIGASGAGKTTVLDILLGLLKLEEGKVLLDGVDIQSDINGWLEKIGYIPQSIFILDASIRSNVAFGREKGEIDDDKVWEVLEKASLSDFVRSLPGGLDTELGERGTRLSGGQRQRIGIARALYDDPEILFFDEATSALDVETEAEIMKSIDLLHGTKTMVIIAHRLSTVANCDKIFRVENGTITEEKGKC